MEDLHAVGGIPAVNRLLLADGHFKRRLAGVTGRTIRENLAELRGEGGQDIVRSAGAAAESGPGISRSLRRQSGARGACQDTGKEGCGSGPAKVFDSERNAAASSERSASE